MRPLFYLTPLVALLTGCGAFPESVKMGDPKLKPFSSMYRVNRQKLGLTPIPKQADVAIEIVSKSETQSRGYAAMLHIYAGTSRTVNFKKVGGAYVWTGEQEIHTGPSTYTTVDGTFNEQITITYETSPVSGYPLNKINVDYDGNNTTLESKTNLTLKDVQPTLKAWQKLKPQAN